MADTTERYFEFGNYRIDVSKRLLYRDGVQVPLTPKVFDTLLVLVENKGRTVDKGELMDLLWQDSFVEESNLAENIRKLRRALDESPGENRFIMTVPRGGYRFVSDVREIDPDEVETVVSEVTRSRVRLSRSGRLGQELPATDIPIRGGRSDIT
jgi:DNA-binding winged helix-turn-helix (wHTH) protein